MNKKILAVCLSLLLLLPSLLTTGCAKQEDDGRLTVVCTVYPIYDWVRQIVGTAEGIEVILLVRNGTDLHSYQPTAQDMATIASCELLIRVGGSSDAWVSDMLSRTPSETRRELILTEAAGVTLREISAESVAQGHAHDHTHDYGEECEIDEHIWLSLKNAIACVKAIQEQLALCQAENTGLTALFEENSNAYIGALSALDARYAATVAQAKQPRLLFADRFPFVYLTEDYGIAYLAAFEGCSTESSATAETMARLAQRVNEWQLSYICVTETSDGELARGVVQSTSAKNQAVVTLHSLQSITADELERGLTYYTVMEQNLTVLEQILLP